MNTYKRAYLPEQRKLTLILAPLLFSLFLLNTSVLAQPAPGMPGINEPETIPKLYLHTDRSHYFPGDTVWFKAYYLESGSQQLKTGAANLYAEIIHPSGASIITRPFFLEEGTSMGALNLPDSLLPGEFLLRAFTDEQRAGGEDYFFHKTLRISKIREGGDLFDETRSDVKMEEVDVAFLPEGGYLLAGISNTAGIRSIDKNGRSISLKGRITDDLNKTLARFHTGYNGMDSIRFTPERDRRYRILLDAYPGAHFPEVIPRDAGIKLEFGGPKENKLQYSVVSNSPLYLQKDYVLAIMHRGSLLFNQRFTLKEDRFTIKVSPEALPAGINRFILMDTKLNPLSERLYFSENLVVNQIQVETDKAYYENRKPVRILLTDGEEQGLMNQSYLSLSVVSSFDVEDGDINMLSYMLLDSELKGSLRSPSDFFRDSDSLSSAEKLNMLMLTQGWSRYLWNTLPDDSGEYPISKGLTLSGQVNKPLSKKAVENGTVSCFLFNDLGFISQTATTDESGKFVIPDLYFLDTVALFIQSYNEKGKSNTLVQLDSLDLNIPEPDVSYLPSSKISTGFPVKLYQEQYYNEKSLRDYLIESGSILIEEVSITRKYVPVDDEHYRIYRKPNRSYKVTQEDSRYQNLEHYLMAKLGAIAMTTAPTGFSRHANTSYSGDPEAEEETTLGGVTESGGTSSGRGFLLNGFPTEWEILNSLPMSDIDVVDYIAHYDMGSIGVFGVNGSGNIISVFTKKGGAQFYDDYVEGALASKITGFSSFREFYSPKYGPENMNDPRPDRRITLFWEPDILTVNGQAMVDFFTSDNTGPYMILVEGITNNGEVCLGSSRIVIN